MASTLAPAVPSGPSARLSCCRHRINIGVAQGQSRVLPGHGPGVRGTHPPASQRPHDMPEAVLGRSRTSETELGHAGLERRGLQAEAVGRAPAPRIRQPVFSSTARMCSFSTSASFGLRRDAAADACGDGMVRRAGRGHDHRALDDVAELADVARPGYCCSAAILSLSIESMRLPNALENSSTKRQTSSGMSSTRSRSGGTWIGNTFSR